MEIPALTFENVAEAGFESTSNKSQESVCSTPSTGNASNQSSASIEKESRRQRKKRKASPEAPVEGFEDNAGLLKTATEQGERITGVMEKMQEAQTKQMDMMTQFMGAMLEMMKNEKSSS